MTRRKAPLRATVFTEAMIDARQASFALCLPYYWFADRRLRAAKGIPHYPLGGLVRFRMSELEQWAIGASCAKRPKGPNA